jgi:hypothetical protein
MDGSYTPQNPHEQEFFNILWATANDSNLSIIDQQLSGKSAVQFFQRSGINVGFLKQIWSLSTPLATMNIKQFYTALRYITMIQNGDMPISKEKLNASARTNFGLPKFNGIDPPAHVPVASAAPTPHQSPAPIQGQGTGQLAPYSISPAEHMKYHELFVTYDVNHEGSLSQAQAFAVLSKSKVDPAMLQTIWCVYCW